MSRIEYDVFKEFKLPHPVVCGLVMKITSPKGIREFREETQQYHYRLHTDLKQIYDGKPIALEPGIYWVVDVAKTKDLSIQWNHYLFKVSEDPVELTETLKPIKRWLNQKSTDWIVEALPHIKKYFLETSG